MGEAIASCRTTFETLTEHSLDQLGQWISDCRTLGQVIKDQDTIGPGIE